MKKLIFILPVFFLTLVANAQQTEDEVYIGKGKTFGNYKGSDVKPIKGQTTVTGIVTAVEWCEEDCLKISVQKDDGTIVIIGTNDYDFTVPKRIVGKRISVEGIEPPKLIRERRTVKTNYQKNIQFAATGIKIIN